MATIESQYEGMAQVPKSLSNLFIGTQVKCQRCENAVYQVEKLGPVNGVIFHKQCFRCFVCSQQITIGNYWTNQMDPSDKEVYCHAHAPSLSAPSVDVGAVGIRRALTAPKAKESLNEQILTKDKAHIDSNAMHIRHGMAAQNMQRRYKQNMAKHHFPAYVANKKQEIREAQQELERQQREIEDRLMKEFLETRQKEADVLKKEQDKEWESRLQELTAQFDRDMTKRGKKLKNEDKKAMTLRFEKEKDDLAKNMTLKMKNKKDAMTLRIQQKEQEITSEVVKKHSAQMLELLQAKTDELKQELEAEKEAKQLNGDADEESHDDSGDSAVGIEEALAAIAPPIELPAPHPPSCKKKDLYADVSVFDELENEVFKVAESEQSSFTELVNALTAFCSTDLEKARAIFRWITVKDLNVLEFDDTTEPTDTPMGILRGIKCGTETYHTLFMRLCSYAGLPCVEIKGHSKSVGYEPGMKIKEESFQNTWNAVLINGDWRVVQCNWGARHLVLNKDTQQQKSKKQENIRYQYDEHYFLTDPDQLIQEFWAEDKAWQLLEKPVTKEEFEQMPFVRSVFFHYSLSFDQPMKAVIATDNKGGAEVKIRVPDELTEDLVFHYQLRFADRERRGDTDYKGAKLERFVFHSLVDGFALFSVHVPTSGEFFLEVFANRIDNRSRMGDDPNATMMPFRLKCACKFKVVCPELVGKMHPLPGCASGEWGPSKGLRHFGLKSLTHRAGVVTVENTTEVRFSMPRPLHFLTKLRMNNVEEQALEGSVTYSVKDLVLTITLSPPQPGQYGLDIYARPEDAADNHTLAHACKYLINCTKVDNPRELPISKVDNSSKMSKDKWGPAPLFEQLGLKTLSHKDPNIFKLDSQQLTIEIGLTEPLKFSYHLIREPDEDNRNKVSMKDSGKKVKFHIGFGQPGNYLFAIYARKKKDSDTSMANVYNYMIRYTPEEKSKKSKSKSKK